MWAVKCHVDTGVKDGVLIGYTRDTKEKVLVSTEVKRGNQVYFQEEIMCDLNITSYIPVGREAAAAE